MAVPETMMKKFALCVLAASLPATAAVRDTPTSGRVDKLTFHYDAKRSGWNDRETVLTPAAVSSDRFGLLWESPQLDRYGDRPARLTASPLYLDAVAVNAGRFKGRFSVAYVASSNGYAYAISTAAANGVAPGTILWRRQLVDKPCSGPLEMIGVLSTPVIDRDQNRIYISACDTEQQWRVSALDLRTGQDIPGWPMSVVAATVNRPGVTRNGTNQFPSTLKHWQRGALNLSPDKSRLYLAFGKDGQSGWLVSVDTRTATVASAFSSTPVVDQLQGGMWGSGGPSIDADGRVHIGTGASYLMSHVRKAGIPGVYPDSAHSWGQSILQLSDKPANGFALTGTYSPFNYCQVAAHDIDLGSSGTILIDLPPGETTTPHLLALGGGKQGNFYLLDRDRMPGGVTQRHGCSDDPESDGSLLPTEPQDQFGKRGPLNLFPPYSDEIGMMNTAKSRSTAAYFSDGKGGHFVFASGSSKTGPDNAIPTPPGLVKVRIVTTPGKPASPRIEAREMTQTFANPASPTVTSNGGRDAIVWVSDPNVPRMAKLDGPDSPRPTLYAFDAVTLKLLWKTAPGELYSSGKYNEPAVVNGLVLVGTDRLQAFGLRAKGAAPIVRKPVPVVAGPSGPVAEGKAIFASRCAGCHETAATGAPPKSFIASLPSERIVTALTTGSMQPLAAGITDTQIKAIVEYLKAK